MPLPVILLSVSFSQLGSKVKPIRWKEIEIRVLLGKRWISVSEYNVQVSLLFQNLFLELSYARIIMIVNNIVLAKIYKCNFAFEMKIWNIEI